MRRAPCVRDNLILTFCCRDKNYSDKNVNYLEKGESRKQRTGEKMAMRTWFLPHNARLHKMMFGAVLAFLFTVSYCFFLNGKTNRKDFWPKNCTGFETQCMCIESCSAKLLVPLIFPKTSSRQLLSGSPNPNLAQEQQVLRQRGKGRWGQWRKTVFESLFGTTAHTDLAVNCRWSHRNQYFTNYLQ